MMRRLWPRSSLRRPRGAARRARRAVLAGLAALGLAASACGKPPPKLARGTAVKVAKVASAATLASNRYTAQIVPFLRVDLAFKVGGYVERIAQVQGADGRARPLQEGDAVAEGTALASLRGSDYDQKVAEAKAAVAAAAAAYREAKRDAARDAKLARVGSLPRAVADTSRSRRDSAAAVVAGARARLEQAKTARADATLVSPLAGVVLRRSVEVGSLAAPGTVAYVVADTSKVKAVFGVPDVLLSSIELGAALEVTTEAAPGRVFLGKVSRLAPAADQRSRVFEVDVTIDNPADELRTGMIASLSLAPGAKPAAPAGASAPPQAEKAGPAATPMVPLAAIVRPPSGAGFAVFVVTADGPVTRAHARQVELGEYLGNAVPIERGLALGEAIVVQGAGLLSDGERVEVIP